MKTEKRHIETVSELARTLGCQRSTARDWAGKVGFPCRTPKGWNFELVRQWGEARQAELDEKQAERDSRQALDDEKTEKQVQYLAARIIALEESAALRALERQRAWEDHTVDRLRVHKAMLDNGMKNIRQRVKLECRDAATIELINRELDRIYTAIANDCNGS